MKYCPYCGKNIDGGAAYCPYCGKALNKNTGKFSTRVKRVFLGIAVPVLIAFAIALIVSIKSALSSSKESYSYEKNYNESFESNTYYSYSPAVVTTPEPTYVPASTSAPVSTPRLKHNTFRISDNEKESYIVYERKFKNLEYGYDRFRTPENKNECFEITSCENMSFRYKATRTSTNGDITGSRSVYVRNLSSEVNENDDGWIYVGSFEYDYPDQFVDVSLNFLNLYDVAAFAIVRENQTEDVSFSVRISDISLGYITYE